MQRDSITLWGGMGWWHKPWSWMILLIRLLLHEENGCGHWVGLDSQPASLCRDCVETITLKSTPVSVHTQFREQSYILKV
jgi:hypothetical protein